MPSIQVVFYQEAEGDSPVVDWLVDVCRTNVKAFLKCRAAIARLALLGHELRRPEADYLADGIYELRVRMGSVNYRLLYFFHGRSIAILAHGLTKEDTIPASDIKRAVARKAAFVVNPTAHAYRGETDDV